MSERIVVVGGGHAAGQFLDSIRKAGFEGELVLVAEEPHLPYQRPQLSKKYLTGDLSVERLAFRPKPVFQRLGVETKMGLAAKILDRVQKRLILSDGSRVRYDRLCLATGSRPRRLPLPDTGLGGIHYFRTIDDVNAIRSELDDAERVVIIGGGFIGLEVAAALSLLSKKVTILEMQDRLAGRALPSVIGRFLEQRHRSAGVTVRLDTQTGAFHGKERVERVETLDGRSFPADLVIVGIGVVPNTELAAAAGLSCEDGIIVDDRAMTEDSDIAAAGDCTCHPNPLTGGMIRLESVHNALEQARTAAASLLGKTRRYHQIPWFWSDQYEIKLQMAGLSQDHEQHVILGTMKSGRFTVCYFREDRLVAVDTVNNPADHMAARKLLNAGVTITSRQCRSKGFDLKSAAAELDA